MIITRTPFRISFFGGGTDYPAWYRVHGGAVLASAINKYCYITCRYLPPFFEHRIRLVYSKTENCQTVDEIAHPAVRAALRYLDVGRGVEIHHDGDLPARSGLGSSSAFLVGLLHALHALQGRMPDKHQLVLDSIRIEQEFLRENVGSQDQTMAAYGGFNHVIFAPDGEISVRPMTLKPERLRELVAHLMLFDTGLRRTASEIAKSYVENIEARERQLTLMGGMVDEAIAILHGGSEIVRFGELLHEAWMLKRSLSPRISNPHIDEIYEAARSAGAIGGKLAGAGAGGFVVLFVRPSDRRRVRERLRHLVHVPFKFEFSGSRVIFHEPEEEYADEEVERLTHPVRECQELDKSPGWDVGRIG